MLRRIQIKNFRFNIIKTTYYCPECQTILKYYSNIYCLISLNPDRASIYLNKKDLNINDLFKHYIKKRLFPDQNMNCPKCGKIQKHVNKSSILYTSPINLILKIYDKNENQINLTIDEYINIGEFVQRTDVSNVNYHLIGAIFIEQNEQDGKKYVSITSYFYNGNSIQDCTFNDLVNHKNPYLLFYSNQ